MSRDLYTHDQVAKAYRNDATVHALVNSMIAVMHQMDVTPAELRAIAMFAAMRFESTRAPWFTINDPPEFPGPPPR